MWKATLGGGNAASLGGVAATELFSPPEALTLYVSTDGSDATGDGTLDAPFKSVTKAAGGIPPLPVARNIVIKVFPGVYDETIILTHLTIPVAVSAQEGVNPVFKAIKANLCTNVSIASIDLESGEEILAGFLNCSMVALSGGQFLGLSNATGINVNNCHMFANRPAVSGCATAVSTLYGTWFGISNPTGSGNTLGFNVHSSIVLAAGIPAGFAATVSQKRSGGAICLNGGWQ